MDIPILSTEINGTAGQVEKCNPSPSSDNEPRICDRMAKLPEAITICVDQFIRLRTNEQPGSLAVCSWDGELTYAELDKLSSNLANIIHDKGIGPEDLVPLCFEKSMWTVVAMLSVLKAGAAFVPLDPSQPVNRLENLVSQTRARLILSSTQYEQICSGFAAEVLVVDARSVQILGRGYSFSTYSNSKDAAYVMFTSGSTGQPKGVVIEHGQLSTFSVIGGEAMGFVRKPRVLQFASHVFDACILEIFPTLVYGGCVCIPSDWQRMNGLVNAMNELQVSSAFFTPSILSNLRYGSFEYLDTVILGGERIPHTLVETWSTKLRLILAYGPTECCVISLILDTSQHSAGEGDIGHAITGRTWIVDSSDYNVLAPFGEIGELLLEGPVLAREYLADKEKTRMSFLINPTWTKGQKTLHPRRFYRTGDLVKYNENDSLKFITRVDNQVKLRGQRLELGEVEYHLRKHLLTSDIVLEVLVGLVTPFGQPSSPILVAFLHTSKNESFGNLKWAENLVSIPETSGMKQQSLGILVAELQEKLALVLPQYAVPSIYVPITQTPLSASGKTDRKKLASIAADLTLIQLASFSTSLNNTNMAPYNLPSTQVEIQLQRLWASVLGLDPGEIKLEDNFLWLGGDSAAAIGLVAAARDAELHLTVETVLKHPVLRDMAFLTAKWLGGCEGELGLPPFALLQRCDAADRLRVKAATQLSVPKEMIEDIYPCSPIQQDLIAVSSKNPRLYILQLVYQLSSSVDTHRFALAWQNVAARNPILRTRIFQDESGLLYQAVLTEPLRWLSLSDTSLDSYLAEDNAKMIQIGEEMSRFALLEDSFSGEYQFVFTIHHCLVDGWSLSQMINFVEQSYHGSLLPPTTGYNKFVKHLSFTDKEASKTFWNGQLADATPSSFPILPTPSYQASANAFIKREIRLTRRPHSNITTATIITAAWSILNRLYTGHSDVIIGMTLNGRTMNISGIEHILGPTIVTIPFRTQFSADSLVSEALDGVQGHYLEIISTDQLGLSDIKSLSDETNAACDFNSLLVLHSTRQEEAKVATPRLLPRSHEISHFLDFALTMECDLHKDDITLRATFDDEVLSVLQVQRILLQFDHIITLLCLEEPAARLSDVEILCEEDEKDLARWNAINPKALEGCVQELITLQSRRHSESPAICSWDGDLSYGELENLAGCLAMQLANHHNIGPNSLVPICFEKSKWAVVAMLAVLQAGGACVALDYKHPATRLKMIIESLGEAGADTVLCSASTAPLFKEIRKTTIVDSTLTSQTPVLSRTSELPKVLPQNPAFVVFTSGSTGTPKGIVLEHRAVCTSITEHGKLINLGPHSRVLQFAAYTFDISLSDIFGTLAHGGCVCILSEHDRMNDLAGAIRSMEVNQANITPSVACQLHPEEVKNLKVIVCAGERMTKDVVERWAGNVELINAYGPAECTIYCTGKRSIQPSDDPDIIGYGIGTLIWITNPENPDILTPVGGVGEVLVEGPNLARGYLGNSSATATAFIEDPAWVKGRGLGKQEDSLRRRFYRTGDLARYNLDGSLTFCGRKDDGQAKIRGQRLEAGEIEYQIRSSLPSDIQVAVVVARLASKPTLTAFLAVGEREGIASGGHLAAISTVQLQFHQDLVTGLESKLSLVLPSYMIPTLFIPVREIPLKSSGKTDWKKLQQHVVKLSPETLASLQNKGLTKMPPSTAMEMGLHKIWHRLLDITNIGVQDNFFQLGGDSITAMRLVALARKEGLSLTVDQIFKNPTLSTMALVTSRKLSDDSSSVAAFSLLGLSGTENLVEEVVSQCNVTDDRIEDIYPCTPQQEFWIHGGTAFHEHQAQSVYSLPPAVDLERFRAAWEAVVASHAILRSRIIRAGNRYFQAVIKGAIDWLVEKSLPSYLNSDRFRLIGLGEPLQRFCIVEDAGLGERYFVFTANHSSYDGWSLHLLFQDLHHTYTHRFSIATERATFNQFIKTLEDCEKDAASRFWKSQMAGSISKPFLTIPEGHTICPNSQWKQEIRLARSHRSNITISTMIEVAWSIVFWRILDSNDIILDILRAGRNAPISGIEELLAPTTTAVPLRIHVQPEERIDDLLSRVQQTLSEMTAYEHLGFGTISELNDEVKTACKNSIRINIAPPVDAKKPTTDMELPLIWAELALKLPFRIDCAVDRRDVVEIEIVFDQQLISTSRVHTLLQQFEAALHQILDPANGQVVADIDLGANAKQTATTAEADDSKPPPPILVESIAAESARVKDVMLHRRAASSTAPSRGAFIVGSW